MNDEIDVMASLSDFCLEKFDILFLNDHAGPKFSEFAIIQNVYFWFLIHKYKGKFAHP